jgi:hypothetical protein
MRASPEGLRKGALNIRRAGATCLVEEVASIGEDEIGEGLRNTA